MAQANRKSRPLVRGCASAAFLAAVIAHAQAAPAVQPPHIRVDAVLIEVAADTIAACSEQGTITEGTLTNLVAKGEATRVASPMLTTQSGVQAQIGIEEEHRYPTAYAFRMTSRTNAAGSVSLHGPVVVPKAITNRTSGLSMRISPELNAASDLITLDLEAEWVDKPRWHDFGSAFTNAEGKSIKPVMLQPLFTSTSVSTSLAMKVGDPHLVQVGVGGRGQVLYLILTCELMPVGGEAAVAAASP